MAGWGGNSEKTVGGKSHRAELGCVRTHHVMSRYHIQLYSVDVGWFVVAVFLFWGGRRVSGSGYHV